MAESEFQPHLYAVIMAGGRGTRFWPVSRADKPKQLLAVTGGEPMIVAVRQRVGPLCPPERILVMTGAAHADGVREVLPDLPPENILAEPVGRNTAPCLGLAAGILGARDPDAIMLALPADHVIRREDEFRALALAGARLAVEEKKLVTFGIKPDRPETGYGYIETGPAARPPALEAAGFREKPDAAAAAEFLVSGKFLWNSGMFVWTAETILSRLESLAPELAAGLAPIASAWGRPDFETVLAEKYPLLPSISIDYAVMEKDRDILVIPADIGWDDVGSWSSAAGYWPAEGQNAAVGPAFFIDSSGCRVFSPDKTVALIGLKDVIVVETPDALLVCAADQDQKVKDLVELLEKNGRTRLL